MVVVRALVAWLLVSGVALAQDAPIPNTPTHVIVDSCASCGGGTTDTDDGSIAAGQVTSIPMSLAYAYNGATWGRLTFGQATMAASIPVTLASNQTALGVTGTLGVTQVVTPWVDNVSQFGGTNVSTGTGAGGAGIPRFTMSNDSTLAAPTTVLNGVRTVTTAGTRVTLTAGSTTAKSVTIKALVANTGVMYVGSSTVSAANGFALQPGDTVTLAIADLQTVNLDSSVNGEGVSYAGVN